MIKRLVAVELEVLVGVSGLPVYGERELPITFSSGPGVQHGQGALLLFLPRELDCRVN